MKLLTSLLSLISLVALPLASFAGQPSGGTTTPTVAFGGTAIPGGSQSTSYVINNSGSYYLAGERIMTADVPAILVNAPDVTIDLNGATIRYTGGSNTWGIRIPACSNVEIRNGSITDVPGSGISSSGGSGLRVNNVRISTCTGSGVALSTAMTTIDHCDISYCGGWGVYSYQADATRVLNSTVSHNGNIGVGIGGALNAEVSNCQVTFNHYDGIRAYNEGSLIANNLISNNNQSKEARSGIHIGPRSTVRNNVMDGNYVYAITVQNIGGQTVVEGNTITQTFEADGLTWGTAIDAYNPGVPYINNRIGKGLKLNAGLVNGGGNILY